MALRIKDLMDEKGIKSVQLSEMVGISKVSISNLLNGKLKPSFDTLEKISIALEVPMWQLFASPDEVIPKRDTAPKQRCTQNVFRRSLQPSVGLCILYTVR